MQVPDDICCGAKGQPSAPLNRSYLNRHNIRLRPGIEQESSRLIKLPGELRNEIVKLALYEEDGITYHHKNNDSRF
jgi:hypothetical protein